MPDRNHEQNDHDDAAAMKLLDELFAGNDPETQLEDDDLEDMDDSEEDIRDAEAGVEGFVDYMASSLSGSGPDRPSSHTQAPITPNQDGLYNQYIRVVHTNRIHHISLVCCSCHSPDQIFTDLIHAGMVPTSVSKIRTLFTTDVLDRFRTSNLEMKSSAYQFFQMLRRITNPLNPSQVAARIIPAGSTKPNGFDL